MLSLFPKLPLVNFDTWRVTGIIIALLMMIQTVQCNAPYFQTTSLGNLSLSAGMGNPFKGLFGGKRWKYGSLPEKGVPVNGSQVMFTRYSISLIEMMKRQDPWRKS